VVSDQQIRSLAYRLWQQRGCPEGSPEVDWFRAEKELRPQTLLSIARVLGSAAGIIAAFVTGILARAPRRM
jgi:hypothetical protein